MISRIAAMIRSVPLVFSILWVCGIWFSAHGAPPGGLRAIAGNGIVSLVWQRVQGATAYRVYRSTTSGNTGSTPLAGNHPPTIPPPVFGSTPQPDQYFLIDFGDTSVVNGTTYYYQVTAVVSGTESAKSSQVQATPVAASTAITKNRFLKILPLGNSITAGWAGDAGPGSNGGYRLPLVDSLKKAGYNFTMVGSVIGLSQGMDMPNHEGWGNRKIPDINYGCVDRAVPRFAPDIIILELGTNDFTNTEVGLDKKDPLKFLSAYDSLVTKIFSYVPHATLLIVPIPQWCFSQNQQEVEIISQRRLTFNAGLKTLAEGFSQRGRKAVYVAEAEAIRTDAVGGGDCLHPSQAGYVTMAGMFFRTINALAAASATEQQRPLIMRSKRLDAAELVFARSLPLAPQTIFSITGSRIPSGNTEAHPRLRLVFASGD